LIIGTSLLLAANGRSAAPIFMWPSTACR